MSGGSGERWCVWGLMGSTDGRTRGRMAAVVDALPGLGWQRVATLATVGSDGYWPHVTVLWRVPDEEAYVARLEAGSADGFDEREVVEGVARTYRLVRGELPTRASAFLVELVTAAVPAVLSHLEGPDLVLAEELAPWQGMLVWGAADLVALAGREREGVGSVRDPRLRRVTGWWATRMPEREIV